MPGEVDLEFIPISNPKNPRFVVVGADISETAAPYFLDSNTRQIFHSF
jgi:hypothetical protein